MGATRIYLAGPMRLRGYESSNFPAFHDMAKRLRDAGFEVCSPAEMDLDNGYDPDEPDPEFDLESALSADLEYVCQVADGVALLDGWEESRGALAEVATALALGKPVGLAVDWECDPAGMSRIVELPSVTSVFMPDGWSEKAFRLDLPGSVTLNNEVRITSSTGGKKGQKLARFDMIPTDSLTELAEHFGKGALKYETGDGGLDNWRQGYPFSLSYGAVLRHLAAALGGEDLDPETQSKHVIAAAWHCFVLAHQMNRPDMVELFDDRQAVLEK